MVRLLLGITIFGTVLISCENETRSNESAKDIDQNTLTKTNEAQNYDSILLIPFYNHFLDTNRAFRIIKHDTVICDNKITVIGIYQGDEVPRAIRKMLCDSILASHTHCNNKDLYLSFSTFVKNDFDSSARSLLHNLRYGPSSIHSCCEDSCQNDDYTPIWYEAYYLMRTWRSGKGLFSADLYFYRYTWDAAHGFGGSEGYTYDSIKGRFLQLDDILSVPLEELNSLLMDAYVKERMRISKDSGCIEQVDLSIKPHGFTITKSGILLYYYDYDIGPYACSVWRLLLPMDKIKTYLKLKEEYGSRILH